ncbi:mutator type transposase [Tanacetum coccineum]|uniref:Mutator type transposase n=1 Tax=Tanacetum coccineum TaxID=301880 RepID=A0ABQ5H9S9_9ASTR
MAELNEMKDFIVNNLHFHVGLLPNFEKVQAASLKPNLCCIQPPSLVTLLRGYIMDDLVQDFFIRPEGNTFDLDVYESYTNLFTIKCHYYGKFNDGPKKEYIEGETCFVDLVNRDQFTDVVLNTVINSLGYEMEDEVLYWYKIPLKSLDVGLKPLVSESDYRRFLGYVEKHKVMDVYVEIVEKNEESESGSDSASESDNDFVDEEHVVQEVEVNIGDFNFQVEDASTGTDGNMIPVAPKVNLTEDNIEVLDFDSLESDLEDVPENDRRLGLRKLKKHSSSKFYIGKEFANRDVAKDLIRTHAVESRRNLHFLRNDPIRIRVVCNGVVPCKNLVTYKVPGPNVDNVVKGKIVNEDAEEDKITCPWLLYLSKGDKGKWFIKTFKDEHHCLQSKKIKYVSNFLSNTSRANNIEPNMLLKHSRNRLQKRFNVAISRRQSIYGHAKAAGFLERRCEDTICFIEGLCYGAKEIKSGRELLGLDGAFIRGQYPGQMLTAVGVDANNGIYPVAYGFYVPALKVVFHMLSTGTYVRHIYGKHEPIGMVRVHRNMLWKCASSTTTVMFEKNMQELKDFNMKAYEWLKQIPAEHWSRAYFSSKAHCDLLINNICEVFNRQLLEARDSPIITALEHVREYLMKRIVVVQKIIEKCDDPLTPAVVRVFDIIKEASSEYIVDWNGADQYQVKGYLQEQYVVNLNQRTCSCRKWEISGIPCKHAIAAIHDMADNGNDVGILEDWVHDSYKLATWKVAYSHKVNPVNSRELWSKFDCPTTLLPPKIHPQIGRPPKKRKKSKGEIVMVKGNKLTRQGKTVTCSLCHAAGHNKRSCDRRQPSQGGTSNDAGVGTQPSEGETSNAAGVGPLASQGGTSNAAGVGTQASQGGTSNATGTQASQASKGRTSNAATHASTGSPLKRTKKSASRMTPENVASLKYLQNIAKRFKEGDITRELVKWYGYVDILEYFEDDAYWDSYSPTTDEKEVPLGKYIPIGKHAAARPIIKSEAFQTGVILGVANQKTWAAIEEKLRKRPSKH